MNSDTSKLTSPQHQIALGSGCFWCTEAIFSTLNGILQTDIGYGGGSYPDPTYVSVSADPCGHSELTVLTYDPKIISLQDILFVFFEMHDPTKTISINDKKGELYRSVILYFQEEHETEIREYIKSIAGHHSSKILTEMRPFINFKSADDKYQQYYASNPNKAFCRNVIHPKLQKLRDKGVL